MLLDLYDYRRVFELEIVAKSALRRTENDLNKLRQNLRDLECHVMNGKETAECSSSFHQLLVESAHSDIALGMFLNIKVLLFQLMCKLEKMKGAPEETLIAHRNILSAVEAGDIEQAKIEMFRDMKNARENLIWSLSNDPNMASIRI
jgi:DNA-binding GntR family transcriptional regulator